MRKFSIQVNKSSWKIINIWIILMILVKEMTLVFLTLSYTWFDAHQLHEKSMSIRIKNKMGDNRQKNLNVICKSTIIWKFNKITNNNNNNNVVWRWLTDHYHGVRRLRTAAINRPTAHPPMIHGHPWCKDIGKGNTWFVYQSSLAILPAETPRRQHEEWTKEREFCVLVSLIRQRIFNMP
jgi:hypothetical protein